MLTFSLFFLMGQVIGSGSPRIEIPYLEKKPSIDGDLTEWKASAFTDGLWDIHRLRASPWYEPDRNRLTDHGDEPEPEKDLRARYYMAWDEEYLYLGAEVWDNRNDVDDPAHEDKRWYYKDSICWFIEAPWDDESEQFGEGDNAFCFVIDDTMPSYGAWWRHGTPSESYVEESLPADAVEYKITMDPWGRSPGDFILEAKVKMEPLFAESDPDWTSPKAGDVYGLQIVHCDPDGGGYGGHFILYGTGDNDATWTRMVLAPPMLPLERLEK